MRSRRLRATTLVEPIPELPVASPEPEDDKYLSQVDLYRLDALRSRWERLDLLTQVDTFKIEETTRVAQGQIAKLARKLELDVIARQKAKKVFEDFQADVEKRYGIDLSVVSYDDETGMIVVPSGTSTDGGVSNGST